MKKILFVGDADADMFITLDHIPTWDEGILADNKQILPGGKAANSAVQYCGLGGNASIFCCIGNDNYSEVAISNFKKVGLDDHYVIKRNEETTLCIMLLDRTGEKAIVVLPSKNIYPDSSFHLYLNNAASQFNHVHLIGLNPEKIIWVAKWAKENGMTVSVDLDSANGGMERCGSLARIADIVFLNRQGLEHMSSQTTFCDESQKIRSLQKDIGGILICTLGPDGAIALSNTEEEHVFADRICPVDTTGCGDAFASGFLYGYFHLEKGLSYSLELGNRCGAAAAHFIGGQGCILRKSDNTMEVYYE